MATLIAKTRIKFGSKVLSRDARGVALTEAGTSVAPGESFEVDEKTAKQMLEDGSAITQADARAKDRDSMTAEQKLQEAADEARAAGLTVSVTVGSPSPSAAIEQAAHREAQERETAAVKEATTTKKTTAAKGKS
jgi:nucleotide-binding universal stress UspA family protein